VAAEQTALITTYST